MQTRPHIRAGRLKALDVGGTARLPEVPTIAESGLPRYEAVNWRGMVAPAGTPPAVITRVHRELGAIVRTPEMQKRFEAEAVEALTMSTADFARTIETETVKWARVVREAGIKAE